MKRKTEADVWDLVDNSPFPSEMDPREGSEWGERALMSGPSGCVWGTGSRETMKRRCDSPNGR